MAVDRSVPVPPSLARRAQLRALAALHDEWVGEHLAAARFDPVRARAKTPSDYNLHYLDVNPSAAAEDDFAARAARVMGLA